MYWRKIYKTSFFLLPLVAAVFSLKKEKHAIVPEEDWVGSITYSLIKNDEGDTTEQDVRSVWKFYQRIDMLIIVKGKNKGIGHVTAKLDNWQQITSPYIKELKAVQITTAKEKGEGQGEVEVWVEMDKQQGIYWIKTDGPEYDVERKTRIWSNIIEMAGVDQPEGVTKNSNPGIPITIPDRRIGNNPSLLTGAYVIYSDRTKKVLVSWSLRRKCPPWNNPLTQQNIAKLDQRVQGPATRFIKRCNEELCIRLKVVASGRDLKEQQDIYASGRTKPGPIRTHAAAGTSYHNFGLAIDVHLATDDGGIDLENEVPPEVVEIGRQEGFEWGGNWPEPKRDPPHFQMTFGQTIQQLRTLHGIK